MIAKLGLTGLAASLALAFAAPAMSAELITNGGFETGDFTGWTHAGTYLGGSPIFGNEFYVIGNGGSGPISGHASQVNAGGGSFVAMSDQNGPGGEALLQSFTTLGGLLNLSFDWFDNDHNGQFGNAIDGSEQNGRVDILFGAAGQFDVGGGVALNLLNNAGTTTGFGTTIPWQSSNFSFSLAAGTYSLRFGNGECCFYQEFGVDNVSLTTGVPETSTWALMIAGFGMVGATLRRRRAVAA